MIKSRIIIVVTAVSLIASVILNLYFYVQNQNVTNNMMTRALGSYGSQVSAARYFLDEYIETHNTSSLQKAAWCGYSAEIAVDVCRQASNDEVFEELYNTAFKIRNFEGIHVYPINDTKLAVATSALDHIRTFFSDFETVKNWNPLEYVTHLHGVNATATIIYYCQIAQDNLE